MEDLQLVQVRESMGGRGVLGTIGIVVGAGALLAVGYYISTKFFAQVDTSGFTADQNTTFAEIQNNTDDAYELSGFMVWVTVAVAMLVIVLGAFAVIGS